MKILVTSDESKTLERAVEYTALFADQAAVTLLYAYRDQRDRQEALDQLDHLAEKLRLVTDCPVKITLQPGPVQNAVLHAIEGNHFDLLVFGSHLRARFRNLRPKYTARNIAKRISLPMLVVFPAWEKLEKILICVGGSETDHLVVRLAGELASSVGADCVILHVMSQLAFRADADREDLKRNAQSHIEHESKEGGYLKQAMEDLREQGMQAGDCQYLVRHGLTVEEIIKESNQGDFDLVVIGGLDVPPEKSWHELRELVQEDIADRVLTEARRPVLIANQPENRPLDWEEL
jgi:nucleotide-binding universal stress UspA family protein